MGILKIGNIGELVTYNIERGEMCRYHDYEIIIDKGKIIEIGSGLGPADEFFDCNNKLVTPGFVDSHTHPVFNDTRENEFILRLEGLSYDEISARGGGILNSVDSLRNASEITLISKVKLRMDSFLKACAPIKVGTISILCC